MSPYTSSYSMAPSTPCRPSEVLMIHLPRRSHRQLGQRLGLAFCFSEGQGLGFGGFKVWGFRV